jgi:hypothetical protein
MRDTTAPEQEALLKAQRGFKLAKDGLTDLMALNRNDPSVFLVASEVYHQLAALHAKAGAATMAQFSNGGVVVMGGGGGR